MLIATAYGSCGVHQMLDVVVLYDTSLSLTTADLDDQISFIYYLGFQLFLHPDHTNIAGIGVDNSSHFGWGLRDYMTTTDLWFGIQSNVTLTGGGSDLSPGMDMAWNNILSSNARYGSTRWLLVLTSTTVMSSTTSLDAMKAAGVKVGFVSTQPATSYTSLASDSRYIFGGSTWSTIGLSAQAVAELMFCPPYCESFVFYYDLPSTMSVTADTNSRSSGVGAYNIHCCGALASLEYKAATSGSFVLQVWRAEYLAYQTTITASVGYQSHTFSQRVAIAAGDVLGWYSAGVNPIGIASNCSGELCQKEIRQVTDMGSLAVGDYYAWSSAYAMPDTAFAIKFTMVNGLISLMKTLPVTGVETPYFLLLSVFDSCLNTASVAFNITTVVIPLAINNLPTEVELGDDVSSETLLIVINATDPAADSISCILSSILPNTTNFRLDDYLNGNCESFDFYYELPNSMAVIADTNSNVGYYLISESKGPSAYNIHCCGALSSLEFKAATSGSFVLQVWRAEYLIYQTTITATAGVNPIGMATSCVGDLCPQDIKIVTDMGSLSVGDFYDWSSASTMPDTAFAIKFTIVNGTVPTFSGGSSPISISESLTVGSSVTVVSLTDDFGDQFMFSDLINPYFEINQTTGLISLMTSLPVTGVETPYFLTMSVMDSCFNTASIAINITTFVQPLAINNLPTEVEIGDDVSFETLLIVINATDPAADSISCILSSILPNTTNFRLDDYLNGTAGMFLNAGAALDFKTVEEYKIYITCTGTSSTESFLTVRILDKSVTTPYTVPAWAAGAIVVSVGSVGVVLAMVCFLIVVILATTDEAEVMPPMEEDENDKTPLDDVAQMCKIIDRWEAEQEGVGEI
uniref:Protocadherin-11 X-linked n=1 Tax=Magallana gigas TaxID=29159 RepID=K1QG92_MAGGI